MIMEKTCLKHVYKIMKYNNSIMNKYEDALDHISFGSKWKLCIGQCLRRWGYNLRQLHMIPHPYAFYPLTPFNNCFFWSWLLRELHKLYIHVLSPSQTAQVLVIRILNCLVAYPSYIWHFCFVLLTKYGFPFTRYSKDNCNS
jgi:hypothetical protein